MCCGIHLRQGGGRLQEPQGGPQGPQPDQQDCLGGRRRICRFHKLYSRALKNIFVSPVARIAPASRRADWRGWQRGRRARRPYWSFYNTDWGRLVRNQFRQSYLHHYKIVFVIRHLSPRRHQSWASRRRRSPCAPCRQAPRCLTPGANRLVERANRICKHLTALHFTHYTHLAGAHQLGAEEQASRLPHILHHLPGKAA